MNIEMITEMANRPEVIKICEPQVCFSMQVQNWMVKRTIVALRLLRQKKAIELLGKKGVNRAEALADTGKDSAMHCNK